MTSVQVGSQSAATQRVSIFRMNQRALLITGAATALIILVGVGSLLFSTAGSRKQGGSLDANYAVGPLAVKGVASDQASQLSQADHLSINGQLRVANTLVLAPTVAPSAPVAGQIYYDQNTSQPYFYNGSQFVSLAPTAVPVHVTSIGGASGVVTVGNGLALLDGQLGLSASSLAALGTVRAAGVTSFQGQTGAVSLSAGRGVSLNGTTVTNTGVINLTSTASQVTISQDGSGNYSLSGNVIGGSGSTGQIGLFTGASTLSGSILSQSGSTVTVGGGLAVTGAITSVSVRTNSLQQTVAGNNVAISAGTDNIVFTAGGRTFTLPTTGVSVQTICTSDATCGGGSASVVALQPGTPQADSGAGSSIAINNTGGGVLLQLQSNGANAFVVNNNGSLANLTVAGGATFNGAVSVTSNNNFSVGTGNTTLGGTFNVTGVASLGSSLGVTGNTTVGGSLSVTGATTFSGLSIGIVQANSSGQLASGTVSRNDNTYLSGTLNAGNGGTGVNGATASNGQLLIGNGAGYSLANLTQGTGIKVTNGSGSITIGVDNTICTTSGNCAGAGAGVTTTGGTVGTVALFTGAQAIGDSILTQSGTTITVAGTLSATSLQGDGSAITALNGNNISSGIVAVSRGGTGANTFTSNGVLYGNGAGAIQVTAAGATGDCLVGNTGAAPSFASCTAVAGGSTPGGAASGDLTGNYPGPTIAKLQGITVSTSGLSGSQILQYNGTAWVNQTISGDITISSTGVATIAANSVTSAKIVDGTVTGTDIASNTITNGNLASGTYSNVTGTGALSSGSIASGFGTISTGNNIITTSAFQGGTLSIAGGSFAVSGAGAVTAATGITSSGAITFSALGAGLLQSSAGGVVSSSAVDRNSGTYFTSALSVANGGTGATTAGGALVSLGAAASGANSDITSLSGLTTALSIGQGGTGATTAAGARTSLGAAASGANADITSLSAVTSVGSTSAALTLQGNASSVFTGTAGGFTTSVGFANPTANVSYLFQSAAAGTYNICTTVGNCSGVGGGVTTAGGTTGKLAKFTSSQTLGDSLISESGSTVTVGGTLAVNTIAPTAALLLGVTAQNVTVQGASVAITSTSGANTNTLSFATPAGASHTITVPNASGTVAVSASGPLSLDANGNLTCANCTTSGGGAGGAVDSLNALNGTVVLQGTANQIVVTNNSGTKTITLSTPQDINTTSNVTFGSVTVTNAVSAGSLSTGGSLAVTGAATAASFNGLTLTANATGFTVAGGTAVRTVTVTSNVTLDQNLATTASPTFNALTLSSLNTAGVVHTNASGVLSTGAVALGTDTSGSYVSALGALTGLSTTGNSGAGSTPTLSVAYGSTANTAAQGNTSLSFSGAGNLTGTVSGTAGGGLTTNTLALINNPSFAGLVTANGGLNVGSTTSLGQITFTDGTTDGYTALLQLGGAISANQIYNLPTSGGTICVSTGNCGVPAGSGNYIQNQNASAQTTANFWISSTGRADTSLLTPTLDTATAVALNIGTTNATAVNLNQNTVVGSNKTFTAQGNANFQAATNSTSAFQIQNAAGTSKLLTVDTVNNFVGIGNTTSDAPLTVGASATPSDFFNATFENNSLAGFTTSFTGASQNWDVVSSTANSGKYSAHGRATAAGGSDDLTLTRTLNNAANISFARKLVAFCSGCTLTFSIDGTVKDTATYYAPDWANAPWGTVSFPVTAGAHTFKWTYAYGTNAAGDGYVDDIVIGKATPSATFDGAVGIGLGVSTLPTYALDVAGDINASSTLRVGGNVVCMSSGCIASNAVNLQSGTPGTAQTGNFNISGTGIAGTLSGSTNVLTPLLDTSAAGTLSLGTTNATSIALNQNTTVASGKTLTVQGSATFQNATDSTSALSVLNTGGSAILRVDTLNGNVGINNGSPSATLDVIGTGPAYTNGFETGTLGPFTTSGGGAAWAAVASGTTPTPYAGSYVAQVSPVTSSPSYLSLTQTLTAAGTVSFYYSCNRIWDGAYFQIDGNAAISFPSNCGGWQWYQPWTYLSYGVSAGTHTFKWFFSSTNMTGSTSISIDNVKITNVGTAGASALFNNGGVGIGLGTGINPSTTLDVNGTIHGSSSLALGQASTTSGSIIFSGSTNANTVTLQPAAQSVGNGTLVIPDLAGTTGTICLQASASCGFAATTGAAGYIQNQNTAQQASSNFWLSGTGRADTSLLTPTLDTATAAALNIGTTNATAVNLNQNTVVASNKTFTAQGSATFKAATNSTSAFQIQNAAGTSLLTADTVNSQVILRSASTDAVIGAAVINTAGAINPFTTGWGAPAGWTLAANSATHTAGLTPLTSTWTPTVGMDYQVSFTYTGCTDSTTLQITMGGSTVLNAGDCATNTATIIATTTDGLSITPGTGYTGIVSNVTVTPITPVKPVLTVQNSSNVTTLEVRSSGTTDNLFIGLNAGRDNTSSGTENTAVGMSALQFNTTGNENTAFGSYSLQTNTTGYSNTAVGLYSLNLNTSGDYNTAIGDSGLGNNTTGSYNVAVGSYILMQNTTGNNNIATGNNSLVQNTTGSNNIALGVESQYNTTGAANQNTALGSYSLRNNTSGSNNTALGYYAGYKDSGSNFSTTATLQNATAIGAFAQVQANNSIVLGSVDTPTMVGIGITVPSNTFSVSPLDYQTGTATRTSSSATLVGTGTTWTAAMVGDIIVFADGTTNTVTGFTNATHITMGTTYAGATDGSPVYYRFHKVGFQVTNTGNAYVQNTSTTAFQVQNALGTSLLTADTTNQQVIVRSGSSDAVLGVALINTAGGTNPFTTGWTTTGWTVVANSATHNSGNTSALSSTWAPTIGTTYQVTYTYSACSSSNTLGVTLGGVTLEAANSCVGTDTETITATSTAPLTFTPSTAYTGSVTNVVVNALTTQANSALTVANSGGTTTLEVRASGSNTNLFIGVSAGKNNTSSGTNNSAIGSNALQYNTSGVQNTALGSTALQFNSTGSQNTATGYQALAVNTTGSNNNASGTFSLQSNTVGSFNTATGVYSLADNITGNNNTAAGYQALGINRSGSSNTANGYSALLNNSAGNYNSANGSFALRANTSGSYNTANGYFALYNSTTSSYNTASGYQALRSNTTGGQNSAFGYNAGYQDSGGNFSTTATLQNATAIGAFSQVQANYTIALGSVDDSTQVVVGATVPVGTNRFGVSPLDYQTGTATRTNSSATLVGTGTTWTAAMVGDIIVFADGTTNTVSTFTDATHITMGTTYAGATDGSPVSYRFHKVGFQVTNTGNAYVQNTSTTAFQVQNASGTSLLTADTTNQQVIVKSSSTDAVLGAAVINTALGTNDFPTSWTTSGWTVAANSATNNGGNTLTLSSTWTPSAGTTYQVSFTYTGCTATNYITITLGLKTVEAGGACNGTNTVVVTAVNANSLRILPTSGFTGTVSNIVVTPITTQANSVLAVANSAGTTTLEVRSSGSNSNVFIGLSSGRSNTSSGTNNTAVGTSTLQYNTTGNNNTAYGYIALQNNSTGNYNTALGTQTLQNNNTGYGNNANGAYALQNNTTGYYNTASGYTSLQNNTSGFYNTASGVQSLNSNTSGTSNTAAGYNTLQNNTSGSSNTASGALSLNSNTTGASLAALGASSLFKNTTGSFNTGVGYYAGNQDSGGFFSTTATLQKASAIGAYSQVQANNTIVLGSVDDATQVVVGATVPLSTNRFGVSPLDYQSGTATRTNSSATLAGTGTTWTAAMVGDTIVFADGTTNTVSAFTDATHITMGTVYAGATDGSPVHYRFHKIGLQVTNAGRVGIGVASAAYQLDVVGDINTSTTYRVGGTSGMSATCTGTQTLNGITIVGGIVTAGSCTTNSADLAENYGSSQALEPGDVVANDTTQSPYVVRTTGAYQDNVVGVVSTAPAHVLGDATPGYPIALAGRVPVKVSLENGPIKAGDHLVASSTPGYAMKATGAGMSIGLALTGYDGSQSEAKVEVFVGRSYYNPNDANHLQAQDLSATDIEITGSANFANLNVSGMTTLANLTVTGSASISGDLTVTGTTNVADITIGGHIIGRGNAPVVVVGTAVGTSAVGQTAPSVGIDGTDTAGTVTITSGMTPADAGVLAELTFAKGFPAGVSVKVALTPTSASALDIRVYVEKTATGFRIVSRDKLAAGAQYSFDYIAIGSQQVSSAQ